MAFVIHLHLGSGSTAAEPADELPSAPPRSSRWPSHSAYVDHLRRLLAGLTGSGDATPLGEADLYADDEDPPNASIAASASSASP